MSNHTAFVPVTQGEPLGAVGFSGLRWGYEEYREGSDKSYDEPHLHLDEYRRDQKTGVKGLTRDPMIFTCEVEDATQLQHEFDHWEESRCGI